MAKKLTKRQKKQRPENPHKSKKCQKHLAQLKKHLIKTGGGGSNMAEPLYFPPGPVKIPDGLPPEEVERRKKASEGIREMLERAASHVEKTDN